MRFAGVVLLWLDFFLEDNFTKYFLHIASRFRDPKKLFKHNGMHIYPGSRFVAVKNTQPYRICT